jgi:hypothetical protein
MKANVLILGASYGSLFSTKLLMAGHDVSLICTKSTSDLINRDGSVVRFPIKGREGLLDISSSGLPGNSRQAHPKPSDPNNFDLIVLGMQEAQYGSHGVRELMGRVGQSRKPCLAIMNMPPLPYLQRIPGLSTADLVGCYADPGVWETFDPRLTTLASPIPRPSDRRINRKTSFKSVCPPISKPPVSKPMRQRRCFEASKRTSKAHGLMQAMAPLKSR